MKKILFTILMIALPLIGAMAQEKEERKGGKRFSHEEFRAKQREFITKHAELSIEEAEAFFPLFFELQKKKWELNRDSRKKFGKKRGEKLTDAECEALVHEFAEIKVRMSELEKEYTDKYLQVIPARKILEIQRAEEHFQRDMLKRMSERKDRKSREKEER